MTAEPTLATDTTFTPGSDTDRLATALRVVLYGADRGIHGPVRASVLALADAPVSGLTYAQQARRAPELLRALITGVGGSGVAIAADHRLRGIVSEWSAIAAPSLVAVLSGHFALAAQVVTEWGGRSAYVRGCAEDLDSGAALGVLALTELAGTNGVNQQTLALWDRVSGGFRLHTPGETAVKFMPNVADSSPRVVVVTARLMVEGRDEGVLPFLVRLRDASGELAAGVRVVAVGDKAGTPMDHAMIRFEDCLLPGEALLGGDWIGITENGEIRCALPPHNRFGRTIACLDDGRLDLGNAVVASARAALAGVIGYAGQRRPGRILALDRGPVQRELVSGMAAVWALSLLGRQVRELRATGSGHWSGIWPMLVKPILTDTAYDILVSCRRLAGAQGVLRANYIPDWISNCDSAITAEGDNTILRVTAGRGHQQLPELQLPGTPPELPVAVRLLVEREQMIAAGIGRGDLRTAGAVRSRDEAAAVLASATGERLAATALAAAANAVEDPVARVVMRSAATVYAAERVLAHCDWYVARDAVTSGQALELEDDLVTARAIVGEHLPVLAMAFGIPALPGAALFDLDYTRPYRQRWHDTEPGGPDGHDSGARQVSAAADSTARVLESAERFDS